MRRRLIEAAIAVVLEESLRVFLPHFLPYAWLAILSLLTLELLNAGWVRKQFVRVYSRFGRGYPVPSYLLAAMIGAGLLCFYWWGIGKAFAMLEREKETHQQPKQENQHTPQVLPSNPVETAPSSPPTSKAPAPAKVPSSEKSQRTQPQEPPKIEIAPSFGNLKARCVALAQAIAQLVQHRYDQQKKYPHPLTQEGMREWARSNDVEFRHLYLSPVKAIRDEFSELHIKDPRLEEILQRDQEHIQLMKSYPQQIPEDIGWISIFDIEQISETLAVLADQVP